MSSVKYVLSKTSPIVTQTVYVPNWMVKNIYKGLGCCKMIVIRQKYEHLRKMRTFTTLYKCSLVSSVCLFFLSHGFVIYLVLSTYRNHLALHVFMNVDAVNENFFSAERIRQYLCKFFVSCSARNVLNYAWPISSNARGAKKRKQLIHVCGRRRRRRHVASPPSRRRRP